MSDTSPYGFELVRRGYDRAQVDERISKLVSDRDSALSRITALEKRIEELHLETQNAQAQVSDAEPSYAGLGARVEKILRLAEEEAKDLWPCSGKHSVPTPLKRGDILESKADQYDICPMTRRYAP